MRRAIGGRRKEGAALDTFRAGDAKCRDTGARFENGIYQLAHKDSTDWLGRSDSNGESVGELSDWICVTTSPEVGKARPRRPFACELSQGHAAAGVASCVA
jgi:hypothetical protein